MWVSTTVPSPHPHSISAFNSYSLILSPSPSPLQATLLSLSSRQLPLGRSLSFQHTHPPWVGTRWLWPQGPLLPVTSAQDIEHIEES